MNEIEQLSNYLKSLGFKSPSIPLSKNKVFSKDNITINIKIRD